MQNMYIWSVDSSQQTYTFQWNERTIQFNEGTRTGKPVSLMENNMYWTELNERTTHIGVNITRFTQWNSRWSNVKLENCTHGEKQSAKTATEVSWVHWIRATGAVNEVAIQLRKKEKCFRFNLSADMHWLIVYTKFSWAWDSGRYRHKRSKARCLGQPEFWRENATEKRCVQLWKEWIPFEWHSVWNLLKKTTALQFDWKYSFKCFVSWRNDGT